MLLPFRYSRRPRSGPSGCSSAPPPGGPGRVERARRRLLAGGRWQSSRAAASDIDPKSGPLQGCSPAVCWPSHRASGRRIEYSGKSWRRFVLPVAAAVSEAKEGEQRLFFAARSARRPGKCSDLPRVGVETDVRGIHLANHEEAHQLVAAVDYLVSAPFPSGKGDDFPLLKSTPPAGRTQMRLAGEDEKQLFVTEVEVARTCSPMSIPPSACRASAACARRACGGRRRV